MQPNMSRRPILLATNLNKSYKGVQVLKNINLELYAGEFVAIIGPSGSGKSTLLHILGCMEKADHGRLTIAGQDVMGISDKRAAYIRNKVFGFVFQFFYMEPHLTIAKNLEMPLMPRRVALKRRVSKVIQMAALVGIEDKLQSKPNSLSGGQLQRAAIARAIINDPYIILADEPTGNLDSENSRNVINLLLEIRKEKRTTLVIVTHDLDIARMADRTIVIRDGELINAEV